MRTVYRMTVLAWLAVWSTLLSAADLAKIERKIAKEPVYQGKPKYCLLVFGPEAKTRVWLVQDGGTLYVDRNADGNLTGPGKTVEHEKEAAIGGEDFFAAGDLRERGLLHQGLTVHVTKLDRYAEREDIVAEHLAKEPKARGYLVSTNVEIPNVGGGRTRRVYQSTDKFYDLHGFLEFADRPGDAPILHFRGPWEATLYSRQRLTVGRDADLDVGVGTPGLGPGTTVWTRHDDIVPERGFLTAEILYPPAHKGQPPIRELYELKKRC